MIDMILQFDGKKKKDEILNCDLIKGIEFFDQSMVIQGDNIQVLREMLKNYRGKIDLIYIDPPFGTKQTFTKGEGRVSTISRSKKGTIAYEDNLINDEYLSFMYERIVLMYELLSEQGSLYLHIGTEMGHYLKIILDEVFGSENYRNDITRIKGNPKNFNRKAYGNQKDMILFYTKNANKCIWNEVKIPLKLSQEELEKKFPKIDSNGRRYNTVPLHAPGESNGPTGQIWRGMMPPVGRHWRTSPEEFDKMDEMGLIEWSKTGNPRIKKFADEHKGSKIQDVWEYKDPANPIYPTEKNMEMLELIIKQSSNKNSIVMDCFCGSGSTLYAAQKLGRKFIGIDQSDEAIKAINSRQLDCAMFKK